MLSADAPIHVIVNPSANQGSAGRRWTELAPRVREHFPNLTEHFTRGEGHACELARTALEQGAHMLIAFGGDGTVNEVLNGFVDQNGNNAHPDAVLGILAAGSGSDFQRMFGHLAPHAQLSSFLAATPRRVDYGVAQFKAPSGANGLRAFLNIASAGLSGEVLHHLKAQQSSGSARNRYLRATLNAIFGLRNHQAKVALYDEAKACRTRKVDLTLASIANGRFFGSGMEISPKSDINDGQLRVLTASVPTRVRLLALLAKVYRGRHLGSDGVIYQPATEAELAPIDGAREIRLELDGEMVGHLPGRFTLRPNALKIQIAGSTN